MRAVLPFGIALCGLFLLGTAQPSRANYYDDPRELDVTGPYTQAASGMVFPETLGDFQRTDVISYNSERTDESASYLLEKEGVPQIAIDVYVYPVPSDLSTVLLQALPRENRVGAWYALGQQLFDEEEQSIAELHPGAELVDGGDTSFDQHGVSYPGAFSTFRYDEDFFGRVQKVRSQLHLFPMVGGKWMVKYRVTYPVGVDGAAEAGAFVHSLPWTIRGLK